MFLVTGFLINFQVDSPALIFRLPVRFFQNLQRLKVMIHLLQHVFLVGLLLLGLLQAAFYLIQLSVLTAVIILQALDLGF